MKKIFLRASIVIAVILIFGVIWLRFFFERADVNGDRAVKDASNMMQICIQVNQWSEKKGDSKFYPVSITTLVDDGFIEKKNLASPYYYHEKRNDENPIAYQTILDLIGNKIEVVDAIDMPFIWSKQPIEGYWMTFSGSHDHESKKPRPQFRNVGYFDKRIELWREEQFQELMRDKILPFVEAQKKKAAKE